MTVLDALRARPAHWWRVPALAVSAGLCETAGRAEVYRLEAAGLCVVDRRSRPYRVRQAEQPAPTGGVGDCWREVLDALDGWGLGDLRALCEARRTLGIERYGVPLGRGDGRDEVRDLVEELADGAVYAMRLRRPALARRLLAYVAALRGRE